MTRLETIASHSRPFTTMAGRVLWAGVVALATACGGGGESTPAASVSQPVVTAPLPANAYSVVVKTVDTQGQPIAGVSVALNGRLNGITAMTGSDGTTTFNFRGSADASLDTDRTGYHSASRRVLLAGAGSPNVQHLTLMREDEAQLVLRGVTSEVSADASSVVVSADLTVSNLNGNPITGLSAANFSVAGAEVDCFFSLVVCPSDAGFYWKPPLNNPVQVMLLGSGPSTLYRVRYVLEATPGMFTAGRTFPTYVDVRVGADTSLNIQVDVRL
jgi:hypothetical protein